MAGYYIYLISSLPMLWFGMKPPISLETFFRLCENLIPGEDLEILKQSIGPAPINDDAQRTFLGWRAFDTALKNELALLRSQRQRRDAAKHIRQEDFFDVRIRHVALAAIRNPSPLEAERMLDQARWDFLEELSVGHYFDLDFLIVYLQKIIILERWQRIASADREELFKQTLSYAKNGLA